MIYVLQHRLITRCFYLLISLLLAAGLSEAQVPVVIYGNLQQLTGLPAVQNVKVRVQLHNCAAIPRVLGSGLVVRDTFETTPGATGYFIVEIYPNTAIDCDGAATSVYRISIFVDGALRYSSDFRITGDTDLNVATPLSTAPPPPVAAYVRTNPSGDQKITNGDLILYGDLVPQTDGQYVGGEDNRWHVYARRIHAGNAPATTFLHYGAADIGLVSTISKVDQPMGYGFWSGFRSQLEAAAGGVYDSQQTVYPAFNADVKMRSAGQALGYWTYIRALGQGNSVLTNGVLEAFGGKGRSGGSWAVPALEAGEIELFQGSFVNSENAFRATISGNPAPGATTLFYTEVANEHLVGARPLLNLSRVTTAGSVSSVSGRLINGSGTSWTAALVGRYLKLGSTQEDYLPPCIGADVEFGGRCYGHWYKITAVNSATQLQVEENYDPVNLPASGTYVIAEAAEVQSIDEAANSLKVAANSNDWAAGDVIVSPPAHIMAVMGWNLVFHKRFKTGCATVCSDGMRLINLGGAKMDRAIWITGDTGTGKGGYHQGIVFNDFNGSTGIAMQNTDFADAALWLPQSTGANNRVRFGSLGTHYLRFDGTQLELGAPAGGASVEFTDGANSSLSISHPSVSRVDFTNAAANNWLSEVGGHTRVWNQLQVEGGILTSVNSVTAGTGAIRMANGQAITFRNAANTADINALSSDSVNVVEVGGPSGVRVPGPLNATSFTTALSTVAFTATPTFNAALGNVHKITLNGNVTSSTLVNAGTGQLLSFIVCQDSTGGRSFTWPANVKGGMAVGGNPSSCSAQLFIFDGVTAWAVSSGVINQ